MGELFIMCHERKILELTLWLSKHLVIMFEKEFFKNTNRCLQPSALL
jgi:hypothetical protein